MAGAMRKLRGNAARINRTAVYSADTIIIYFYQNEKNFRVAKVVGMPYSRVESWLAQALAHLYIFEVKTWN